MTKSKRTKRKSLRNTGPLNFEQRSGYVRRMVNLNGRNYEDALEMGYTPVMKDGIRKGSETEENVIGSAVTKTVNPHSDGMRGILMEIPKDLYDEMQAEKQENVDDIEAALAPQNTENSYGSLNIKKK